RILDNAGAGSLPSRWTILAAVTHPANRSSPAPGRLAARSCHPLLVEVSVPASDLTGTPEWAALQRHYESMREVHLRELFADDADRGTRLTLEAEGLFLDYSKHRLTDETIRLLVALAERAGLRERIDAMFAG